MTQFDRVALGGEAWLTGLYVNTKTILASIIEFYARNETLVYEMSLLKCMHIACFFSPFSFAHIKTEKSARQKRSEARVVGGGVG